ncbi:MAG TPA: zinc ribbon domain-containing protein [Nitrososphaerales archaeon]|nr:zinc ribbon domain-containing protein [Nitrososphaerales archaeon]
MEFHPGRMLGIVLGLVILATIFLLPFGTTNTNSLYGTAGPLISNLGAVQASGTATATFDYILVIAFVLLVIAGLVGIFPLGTGVLGVVGMAMITVAPYAVFPNGPVKLDPGTGFYIIWVASVLSLGASFWHRKKKETAPVNVNVTQTMTTTTVEHEVKCPKCGTMNPSGALTCSKCGSDLPKTM